MEQFGVYILTYPGDFHLSTALVNSLRYFHPDIPITIIPGEGFNSEDHPFDVSVMPEPDGFWGKMCHIDRKYWAYQGAYEKFLYLDADMICTRSLGPLIDRIMALDGPFILVQEETGKSSAWVDAIANSHHERHTACMAMVRGQLGDPEKIAIFDEEFDAYARYPFNAGIFASCLGTLTEKDFEDLNKLESEFYRSHLGKSFSWSAHDLFFADQGRINYLVQKRNVPILDLYPDGHFLWGGTAKKVLLDDVLSGDIGFGFIHWAGCPRPSHSFFCKGIGLSLLRRTDTYLKEGYDSLNEIPGYTVWRYFWSDMGAKSSSLAEKLEWTYKDFLKILVASLRAVRKLAKGT